MEWCWCADNPCAPYDYDYGWVMWCTSHIGCWCAEHLCAPYGWVCGAHHTLGAGAQKTPAHPTVGLGGAHHTFGAGAQTTPAHPTTTTTVGSVVHITHWVLVRRQPLRTSYDYGWIMWRAMLIFYGVAETPGDYQLSAISYELSPITYHLITHPSPHFLAPILNKIKESCYNF